LSDFSNDLRALLLEHLRSHAVRTDGPFTLRSGEISDWYIDARQTTLDGAGAALVGRALLAHLPAPVTAVGGMTMGADPISVSTALIAGLEGRALKAFSIRQETKDHGTGGRTVGPVGAGDIVAVVEDTTTTGSALIEAIQVARDSGLQVEIAIALVDRSRGLVASRLAALGIGYAALFTSEELSL
jgi:orotate phosphoribosyltransferase